MRRTVLADILMAIALSVVCNYIAYYGFTTNYSRNVFSKESFTQQYEKGIYRYRVAGRIMVLKVYEFLEKRMHPKEEARLTLMDDHASSVFYAACFIVNTMFLAMAAALLVLILHYKSMLRLSPAERTLFYFLVTVLMCFSQYVVTPYDASSYFLQFLIIGVFFSLYDRQRVLALALLSALIFLSSFNRESSALSLAFLVLLIWLKEGLNRGAITSVVILTASFLAAYISIRYFDRQPSRLYEEVLLKENFTKYPNLLGLLLWGVFLYLAMKMALSKEHRYIILAFHLVCIPYIITCLVTGILFEVRLYLPILFGSLILSRLNTEGFKVRLPSLRINK